MKTLTRQLKEDLNKFIRDFGVSKTTLGLSAVKNPHTVHDFISGKRTMTLTMADALYRYMSRYKKEYGDVPSVK